MKAAQRPDYEARRTLVVIPTYNEAENLEPIVGRLFSANPGVDCLVVDDGSPDGTGKLADALADDDSRLHVLHRSQKAGLGAAYIAGFRWAIEQGYEVVVEMDADGSHAPEQLPRLLQALDDADVALGSRWVPGGAVLNWPLRRKLLSRGGNLYTQLALGMKLRDATGGFRAYRREVLEAMHLELVSSQGYCFQVDMAWGAARAGYRVVEVPITFVERVRGESKMSGDIVKEALTLVTRWGYEKRSAQVRAVARRLRG